MIKVYSLFYFTRSHLCFFSSRVWRRGQRAEGRGQRAEGREQRAEGMEQRGLRSPLSALRLFNFEPAMAFIVSVLFAFQCHFDSRAALFTQCIQEFTHR